MNRIAAASTACLTLIAGIASPAASAEKEFRGYAEIIKTLNCVDRNPLGWDFKVRFLPANVADNGNRTDLGIFSGAHAQGYSHNTGYFTSTMKTAAMIHIGSRFGIADYPVKMRLVSQTPATILTTTKFINMEIQILGFDWMATCLVNMRLSMQPSVD